MSIVRARERKRMLRVSGIKGVKAKKRTAVRMRWIWGSNSIAPFQGFEVFDCKVNALLKTDFWFPLQKLFCP